MYSVPSIIYGIFGNAPDAAAIPSNRYARLFRYIFISPYRVCRYAGGSEQSSAFEDPHDGASRFVFGEYSIHAQRSLDVPASRLTFGSVYKDICLPRRISCRRGSKQRIRIRRQPIFSILRLQLRNPALFRQKGGHLPTLDQHRDSGREERRCDAETGGSDLGGDSGASQSRTPPSS